MSSFSAISEKDFFFSQEIDFFVKFCAVDNFFVVLLSKLKAVTSFDCKSVLIAPLLENAVPRRQVITILLSIVNWHDKITEN